MNLRPVIALTFILATATGYTADKPWTEPDAIVDACLAAPIGQAVIPHPFNHRLTYNGAKGAEEQ